MGDLSIWHWIVVIAVLMLLFGRGKVSDLMGDLAQGIKAFKNAMSEDDKPVETLSNATNRLQPGDGTQTAGIERQAESARH
jgi:sec-independent protein translocase protein TatA